MGENESRSSLSHRLCDGLDKHALVVTTSFIHGEAGETSLFDILSLDSCDRHVNDNGYPGDSKTYQMTGDRHRKPRQKWKGCKQMAKGNHSDTENRVINQPRTV